MEIYTYKVSTKGKKDSCKNRPWKENLESTEVVGSVGNQ